MKVTRSNVICGCLCINENKDGNKMQLQGLELTKEILFKYLGLTVLSIKEHGKRTKKRVSWVE